MPLDADPRRELHREKTVINSIPDDVCVARPVGQAEIACTFVAKTPMKKEWDLLGTKDVWDESAPREREDVREEATRVGITFLHGICLVYGLKRTPNWNHHFGSLKGERYYKGIVLMIRMLSLLCSGFE